jgi:hypothetical protein
MRVLPILFLLGAYHGLNPAMGWLFAVARGLQRRSGKGVVNSLMPLGLGHLASIAAIIGAVQVARFTLPLGAVRVIAGIILIGFGLYRLVRRRHPRWVGMQVGPRDLTLWSFLMASAHGAGLMLLPFVLTSPGNAMPITRMHHMMVASAMAAPANWAIEWWFVMGLHTLGYLLATALLALLVYYKLGVAVLRRAWFNLDLLWVGALLAAGVLTLVL